MIRLDSLVIGQEHLAIIGEIDEFKGAWRAIGRLAPERLNSLRMIATIESVGSSTRIEGVTLSDREIEALLGRLQVQSFATRDEQEVAGYARLMETIFESHAAIPITENYIKQMHSMLLQFSEKDSHHRGKYKTLSNSVEAFDPDGKSVGVIFRTATPFDTPREMEELIAWYSEAISAKELHPLIVIAVFVVVFLAIHPFQDGNGRLSRALTTLHLLKSGYAYVPFSSHESFIERNKEGYYLALRRTQGTLAADRPEWGEWMTYFLRTLRSQKRHLESKVERESQMQSTLPELSITILDLAVNHGQLSVADIVRLTGAPRGTVRKRLGELEARALLLRTGRSRATRYSRA